MTEIAMKKSVEVSSSLLDEILSPYKESCKYLKKMYIDYLGTANTVVGRGEFSIEETFYIQDTGHFNSVEFNICCNQLGYVFFAYCIQEGILPELQSLDLATYKRLHLSGFLILEFFSSFRKPMHSRQFYGTLSLDQISEKKNLWLFDTSFKYYDDLQGRAEGRVLSALLKPTAT
jgi:hypothetical protein